MHKCIIFSFSSSHTQVITGKYGYIQLHVVYVHVYNPYFRAYIWSEDHC